MTADRSMSEETVALIAAIVASVIGVGTFFHYFLHVQSWPRAWGKVIGNSAQARSGMVNSYAYFPLIEFHAADGLRYEFRGDFGRNGEWPIGQTVRLRYRPANPSHATIAKAWQRLFFSLVFMAFGAAAWGAWLGILR